MALNLIILGPPGAGKGTQAERVARACGIPKTSTGDILREAVQDATELGRCVKAIMDRGELVGDDLIISIVRDRLAREDALGGFVLDGFPRTVAQASALDAMLDGRGPLVVLDIVVPESELVRRLASRRICEACGANAENGGEEAVAAADTVVLPAAASAVSLEGRTAAQSQAEPARCRRCGGRLVQRPDDSADVVRERLKVYQRRTEPLVEYYRQRPTFRRIDGAAPPDHVAAELAAAIESVASGLAAPEGVGQ